MTIGWKNKFEYLDKISFRIIQLKICYTPVYNVNKIVMRQSIQHNCQIKYKYSPLPNFRNRMKRTKLL